jgi:ABC-2 type transport system permease protein
MQVLRTLSKDEDYPYNYIPERIEGTYAEHRAELMRRVLDEELDGYVVIPADVVTTDTILYRARNIANRTLLRDVGQAASAAVQAERLSRSGIAPSELVDLLERVHVDEAEVTQRGEEGRGAATTFWFAYMAAFLVYFMVAFYGVTVMRSVLEEKMNRISEVMVSSVRSIDLMLGKILGVSGAALLQVGIWGLLGLIATGGGAYLPRLLGIPSEILASFTVPFGQVVLLLAFFLLGFLMFASIYAALGAAMTTEQEAQSMTMLVLVPLFVPLLFIGPITNEPSGALATALSLIPFCAPIAMPMRLATAPVPAEQIALSLALLAVGVLVVAWVGGRVYRIGILSTGTKPSWREFAKWLREA